MFAFALAAFALAANPVAPASAELVLWAPVAREGLPPLRAFLEEAGGWAPAVRPGSMGPSLGSLLAADVLDVRSLEQAGVDVDAPLSLFTSREGTALCLRTKGPEAARRWKASLQGLGTPASATANSIKLTGALVGKGWRAGTAVTGTSACMASGSLDAQPLLKAAAEALSGPGVGGTRGFAAATKGLAGPILLFAPGLEGGAAAALFPTKEGLSLKARIRSGALLLAPAGGQDALASLQVPAAFVASAGFAPAALSETSPASSALRFLASNACPTCDPALSKALWQALQPRFTGSAALVVTGVDPTSLSGKLARYFLVPHAYLLALREPAAVQAALSQTMEKLKTGGARVATETGPGEGIHFGLAVDGRKIFAGVADNFLYVANDADTRNVAVRSALAGTAAKTEHSGRFVLDGPRTWGALRRISLLDVTKSADLAALFAVSVEAGPLLKAVGPFRGFVDPEPGGARIEAGFTFQR